LGTESNGAFRNITISNVVFERSRGLALETVDGATIEDVAITNVTMREVTTAPIFFRIGARLRGPTGTTIGAIRRVTISNVIASGADPRYASIIAGLPGHPVEDVTLRDVRLVYRGGLSLDHAARQPAELVNTFFRPPDGSGPREPFAVPEREKMYPEPSMFGVLPAYGFYVRHAAGIRFDGVSVSYDSTDTRPAFVLDDVKGAELHGVRAQRAPGANVLVLRDVQDVRVTRSAPLKDAVIERAARKSY
jgi:polygalacturonase